MTSILIAYGTGEGQKQECEAVNGSLGQSSNFSMVPQSPS